MKKKTAHRIFFLFLLSFKMVQSMNEEKIIIMSELINTNKQKKVFSFHHYKLNTILFVDDRKKNSSSLQIEKKQE